MALTAFPGVGDKLRGEVLWDLFNELYGLAGIQRFDQNVGPSNTTMQPVDDVAVAVEAVAVYEFDLVFQHSTNTTADIKFGFSYPDGLAMDYAAFVFGSTGTWVATRNNQTAVFSPNGGSTQSSCWLHGTVVTAAAGTLQLMAAQNTSDASNTLVEAGAMFRLTRIA